MVDRDALVPVRSGPDETPVAHPFEGIANCTVLPERPTFRVLAGPEL
jgi:hypothetical protein